MEYFCTTCCREKNLKPGLLPALTRYLDPRIAAVYTLSTQAERPFVILSGKFGLIKAQQEIPYYDQALVPAGVGALQKIVVGQLLQLDCTALNFFGLPPQTPGWEPYYQVLEGGCSRAKVELKIFPCCSNGSPG